jgi:pimeloyl-ACP methyl ester carboxylesterase
MLIAANRNPPDVSRTLARALVAALVQHAMDAGHPGISGGRRSLLVAHLVPELGKQPLGAFDWITKPLLGIATARARRRRRALAHASSFVAGDIILYQSRGQPIRDYIRDAIVALDKGVVVLGHSLGGIAAFEALIENDLSKNVEALVTIGSQAPFFYEIDALTSLRVGSELPSHFPRRWLNIWDPNDFLSFVTEGVIRREIADNAERATYKIEDHKVESGVPFPAAHSAYWDQDAVWTKIGSFLR